MNILPQIALLETAEPESLLRLVVRASTSPPNLIAVSLVGLAIALWVFRRDARVRAIIVIAMGVWVLTLCLSIPLFLGRDLIENAQAANPPLVGFVAVASLGGFLAAMLAFAIGAIRWIRQK